MSSDDENEDAEVDNNLEQVSIFASKKQLMGLLDAIAANRYEATFSALAKELGTSAVLEFTTSSMKRARRDVGANSQSVPY